MHIEIRKFPVLDTGLGREAGYENDQALIEAATEQRKELEAVLTPEALARLDEAEREADRRFLGI